MKIDKKTKEMILEKLQRYYNTHQERKVSNPYFEYCTKDVELRDQKCGSCHYKNLCQRGEEIWEINKNIIRELLDEILKWIK